MWGARVEIKLEMFYLNSTLNFGIVLVFQLEVSYKVDRLLTGLTAQQKGTNAQWYTNKTSLPAKFKKIHYLLFTLTPCMFVLLKHWLRLRRCDLVVLSMRLRQRLLQVDPLLIGIDTNTILMESWTEEKIMNLNVKGTVLLFA